MSRRDITGEDLVLYAMHLLPPEEQSTVEQLLLTSPEGRAETAAIRGDLAVVSLASEMQSPPASARQRLLKQVVRERKTESPSTIPAPTIYAPAAAPVLEDEPTEQLRPMAESDPPFLRSFQAALDQTEDHYEHPKSLVQRTLPWIGWAAAIACAGVSAWELRTIQSLKAENAQHIENKPFVDKAAEERTERAQTVLEALTSGASQRIILTKPDIKPPMSGEVTYLADRGALVFQASHLEPLPEGKTYELWLIPSGSERKPVAVGAFHPDSNGYAEIILPEIAKGIAASKFGVTMEEQSGSEEPTLPILLIGQ